MISAALARRRQRRPARLGRAPKRQHRGGSSAACESNFACRQLSPPAPKAPNYFGFPCVQPAPPGQALARLYQQPMPRPLRALLCPSAEQALDALQPCSPAARLVSPPSTKHTFQLPARPTCPCPLFRQPVLAWPALLLCSPCMGEALQPSPFPPALDQSVCQHQCSPPRIPALYFMPCTCALRAVPAALSRAGGAVPSNCPVSDLIHCIHPST